MEQWFKFSTTGFYAIILTAIGIYIATIICTRIAGKRSFSKMSSFDFAMTVAIGSIVATTIVSKSVSLLDGIVGIAITYSIQLGMAFLRRFSVIEKMVDNSPLMLMDGQNILHKNLKKVRVTEDDLRSKLREANVLELSQVRAVVMEATGDIAVLHTCDKNQQVEDFILQNVKR